MTLKRTHLIEKVQVQCCAALAIAAVYALAGQLFRANDPLEPVLMLTRTGVGLLGTFALVLVLLAAVGALATLQSRSSGAMLVVVAGMLAVSVRSPGIRTAMAAGIHGTGGLYARMIVEILLLGVLAGAAAWVLGAVRGAVGRIRPRWVWQDRIIPAASPSRRSPQRESIWVTVALNAMLLPFGVLVFRADPLGALSSAFGPPKEIRAEATAGQVLQRCASFVGVGAAIAVAAALLVVRSGDRGQILFGLGVAGLLGALGAWRVFPVRAGGLAMAIPIVAAVVLYGIAAMGQTPDPESTVPRVAAWAQALPIDWFTAGGSGALLGVWLGARFHESKNDDADEKE